MGIENIIATPKLLQHKGYYYSTKRFRLSDTLEMLDELSEISSNILGLLEARGLYCGEENITFIQEKPLPDCKIILLSATADPESGDALSPAVGTRKRLSLYTVCS